MSHDAECSIHTDACPTWNEGRYTASTIRARHDIKSKIKVWLDDCLLHTKTDDDLLETFNFILKQCQKYGLKMHACKCVLFATIARYCERSVTKDGMRFDPKNMEALQTTREPQNGADLVHYVAAVNWMRSAIPSYSKRMDPLQESLAKCSREPQNKESCSRSVAATRSRTRRASGFQRFTRSFHGANDVGLPKPRKDDLCIDGCLRSLLCWLVTQISSSSWIFQWKRKTTILLRFCQASS
jgi:hypothetical protein